MKDLLEFWGPWRRRPHLPKIRGPIIDSKIVGLLLTAPQKRTPNLQKQPYMTFGRKPSQIQAILYDKNLQNHNALRVLNLFYGCFSSAIVVPRARALGAVTQKLELSLASLPPHYLSFRNQYAPRDPLRPNMYSLNMPDCDSHKAGVQAG